MSRFGSDAVRQLGYRLTRGSENWVEYCNSPSGTQWSNLRHENGHEKPFAVPLWCLGNEMDGPWQLGHAPVEEYISRARQAAKMMKDCDPSIQTVACGSSGPQMPTYPVWDRTVLEELGGLADYISLHRYVGNLDNSSDYLAISNEIDRQIEQVNATALYAQAKRKSRRRTFLCFDEWNVWYRQHGSDAMDGRRKFAPALLEEQYNLENALVVAGFLMSFIRHADCVKIANMAQLVNVIALIFTIESNAFRQTIFHAFKMIASRKGGVSLQTKVESPNYESKLYGTVSCLDCAAIGQDDRLKVFAVNRHLEEPMQLTVHLHSKQITSLNSSELLYHDDLYAVNSFGDPDNVSAKRIDIWSINGTATIELPPHSQVAATFTVA